MLGGGIAGLTTAYAIQKLGYSVSVFEAAKTYLPIGAGIALSVNATKALGELEIEDSVLNVANVCHKMQIKSQKGRILSSIDMQQMAQQYGHSMVTVHRAELHRVLMEQLHPETVQMDRRCVSMKQGENGVSLVFDNGRTASGDFLIAADGLHSRIRKQLHPDAKLRYSGYTCWRGVCHFKQENFNIQHGSESWGWGERFGIFPLANDQVYWFMVKNAPYKDPLMSAFDKEKMLQVFGHWHDPIPQLIEATKETNIVWHDLVDIYPLKTWGKDRVTLIGDAAHAVTPNMGQGACQGIEDAVFLMKCLEKYGANQNAFRKYEQLRIGRTTKIIERSWQLGKVAQWENPVMTFFRNLGMKLTPNFIARKQMDWLYSVDYNNLET